MDTLLGFSAGVMIAASYWSLLEPALQIARDLAAADPHALPPYAVASLGFLVGGLVLWGIDKSLPHLHLGADRADAEGPRTAWRRSVLLVLAITKRSRIAYDAALGIVLSVFFGFGMVLLTFIQRLPSGNQAGLDNFLFGQAAALLPNDVLVMSALGKRIL